jgi:hypothetical protein
MEILKFKKDFTKKDYQINPDIYWKILLSMSFVIMVTSFFYGSFVFSEMNKDTAIIGVNTNDKTIEERKIRIDKILGYFTEKEKKSESILESTSTIVDPSL